MTCIAAVAEKGKVFIGGDSAGVEGLNLTIRADKKVFINSGIIFGFTSSFRMGQLLKYKLVVPKPEECMADDVYMNTLLIDAVRKCLKDGGYSRIDDNEEEGGNFIVGYNGKIYEIECDFQVGQPVDQFAACGCGAPFALATLCNLMALPPEERIKRALETAEHFSAGVRGPFYILNI